MARRRRRFRLSALPESPVIRGGRQNSRWRRGSGMDVIGLTLSPCRNSCTQKRRDSGELMVLALRGRVLFGLGESCFRLAQSVQGKGKEGGGSRSRETSGRPALVAEVVRLRTGLLRSLTTSATQDFPCCWQLL